MRSTKWLMAAAVLIAGMGVARADVYSVTQQISGGSDENSMFINFTADGFNDDLGPLTGVAFAVSGDLGTTVFDSDRIPPTLTPLPLTFTAGISITADGLHPSDPGGYVPNAGTFSGVGDDYMVQASGPVSASFIIPNSAFSIYTQPGGTADLGDSLSFGATDHMTDTGQFLSFDGQAYQFSGYLTETFTYTPAADPVPEPGSLALLATSLLMLVGVTSLTMRRRPRS